jgi:hypothetical protein
MTSASWLRRSPESQLGNFTISSPAMPHAIISPSVLASDLSQLTAECKRMIKSGAEWLHMGTPRSILHDDIHRKACDAQMSWTGKWKFVVESNSGLI